MPRILWLVTAGILIAVAILAAGCVLGATRSDRGPDQDQRQRIVEMIRDGELPERDKLGRVILPDELRSATRDGLVHVSDEPFTAFFLTWTGSGPDPYCGYGWVADGASVNVDPLGSGTGEAEAIGDNWYWICAS